MRRLRRALYWAAVVIGMPFIILAVAGAVAQELLEAGYARLRHWTHQEEYARARKRRERSIPLDDWDSDPRA